MTLSPQRSAARAVAVAVGIVVGLLWVQPAHSYPIERTDLVVEWDAPPSCPGPEQIRAQLHELAGGVSSPNATQLIRGRVSITRSTDRLWSAVVLWSGAADAPMRERSVEGEDCVEVSEAAVLFLALALQPTSSIEREQSGAHTPPAEGGPDCCDFSVTVATLLESGWPARRRPRRAGRPVDATAAVSPRSHRGVLARSPK